MPNTNPPTANMKEFNNKLNLAKNRMYSNYAFYFGATPDNSSDLAKLKGLDGCCGVKLFAGSSTGNLLVDKEEDIEKVFKYASKVVAVHSEDEEILKLRKKVGNESILERSKTEQTHRYITSDHEMNLVFSENTGEYLNKTSANVIPSSKKEKITELPENTEKTEIINPVED